MERIVFDNALELGIKGIDDQHRRFIGYINDAWDALERGDEPEQFLHVLNQLMDYCMAHFAFEEALMREHQYPGFEDHKEQHTRTASELFEFDLRLLAREPEAARDFVAFLQGWLANHIQVVDVELAKYLRARGVE